MPPAKFVEGGLAQESIVGVGSIISGSTVRHSVISPNVRIQNGAYVEGSVLMDNVKIGAGAVVRRAILDKNVVVPPGAHIGVDLESDRQRYHVSEGGVVVIGNPPALTFRSQPPTRKWVGGRSMRNRLQCATTPRPGSRSVATGLGAWGVRAPSPGLRKRAR